DAQRDRKERHHAGALARSGPFLRRHRHSGLHRQIPRRHRSHRKRPEKEKRPRTFRVWAVRVCRQRFVLALTHLRAPAAGRDRAQPRTTTAATAAGVRIHACPIYLHFSGRQWKFFAFPALKSPPGLWQDGCTTTQVRMPRRDPMTRRALLFVPLALLITLTFAPA